MGGRLLISHEFLERSVKKEVDDEVGFFLSNRCGGFFNLGIKSKYRGLFFRYKDDVIKILDDIFIDGEVKEIRNKFWKVDRLIDSNQESFFMPIQSDSFVYEIASQSRIHLLFDVKKGYDSRVWGRNYDVSFEGDIAILEFTKMTDNREDDSHGKQEYTVFAAIKADTGKIEKKDKWTEQYYPFDEKRKSYPSKRYVYDAIDVDATKVILTFSENKEKAMTECNRIFAHLTELKSLQKKYTKVAKFSLNDDRLFMAYKCAIEALDSLKVTMDSDVDLYAGLPWFFQFWGRDSLISLKALMLDNDFLETKKIMMKMLDHIGRDGLLPNRYPETITKSADAIGWYFKRWDDFLKILRKSRHLRTYFKKREIMYLIKHLEDSLDNVFKHYTQNGLAINEDQETWMDTSFNGDGRKGARIEIQALRILMYDFLYRLTDLNIYREMADKLQIKTISEFWNGSYLKDGVDDPTIRPNQFIAAYIYPELISKEEWSRCFENILPRLWLSWGGLASIDKGDPRFHLNSTGEDPSSYHHGDSWYWLNNLVALVLLRTDPIKFRGYIEKIIEASSEDILFSGFVGANSEISSAANRSSLGCLNQAWSNALFVELMHEYQKLKN